MKRLLWVILLAAAVILAVLLHRKTEPSLPVPSPQAPESAAPKTPEVPDHVGEWNTYHADSGLTGFSRLRLPASLRLAWTFQANAAVTNTPVASAQHIYVADSRGTVYALAYDGSLAWSRTLDIQSNENDAVRPASLDAPLAAFDGSLYACDADGMVIALHTASGEERWRHFLDIPILGSPNYGRIVLSDGNGSRGTLFVIGQDNGTLYALEADNGTRLWATEGVSRCDGSPGVGGNRVVFGSCDSALHVFSMDSGAMERNVPIPGDSQVASGVAIFQGSALSGCRSGKLLRVHLDDGAVLWSAEITDDEIFGTPAVNGTHAVITAEDGCVYAVSFETGEQLWKACLGRNAAGAVIAGDKVLASSDGSLYLLNLTDGERLWSRELADELTRPAIAGPLVVVGADDGTVLAFAAETD